MLRTLASTLLLWRRWSGAPRLSLATGVLLLTWVAIQTAIIGFRHRSQAIWWAVFTTVTVVAGMLTREARAAR